MKPVLPTTPIVVLDDNGSDPSEKGHVTKSTVDFENSDEIC